MENNTYPKEHNKQPFTIFLIVFVTIMSIFCITCLIVGICTYSINQKVFNETYIDVAANIKKYSYYHKDFTRISIEHLERLQAIQQKTSSNDFIIFLLSTICTIFAGIGAGLVAKIMHSVRVSNEAALRSKTYFDVTKKIMEEFEGKRKEFEKQGKIIKVLRIQNEFIFASTALKLRDQVSANVRIKKITDLVLSLESFDDHDTLFQLQNDLLAILDNIKITRDIFMKKADSGKKKSMLQSLNRYEMQINEAASHCTRFVQDIY